MRIPQSYGKGWAFPLNASRIWFAKTIGGDRLVKPVLAGLTVKCFTIRAALAPRGTLAKGQLAAVAVRPIRGEPLRQPMRLVSADEHADE